MTLIESQNYFAGKVAELIIEAQRLGYSVSLGEAFRPAAMASIYASLNKGIRDSNHCRRLAIDLNLILGTKYLRDTSDYAELGAWWEKQSSNGQTLVWGGHFQDGNHFSLLFEGIK